MYHDMGVQNVSTDKGASSESDLFAKICEALNISKQHTSGYHGCTQPGMDRLKE